VPASFARDLCGFRSTNGNPSTSDNNDKGSVRLGRALFEVLEVPLAQADPGNSGDQLEEAIALDVHRRRPDLSVHRSRAASSFEQYAHLAVFGTFTKAVRDTTIETGQLLALVDALPPGPEKAKLRNVARKVDRRTLAQQGAIATLLGEVAEESLLKIDITVADGEGPRGRLELALSSKWSLRTDRAQDCVSQGSKLVAQRRGRMPHFAVVTMEPRPSMLRILADGSGAIDCVYHLDLEALRQAIRLAAPAGATARTWSPWATLDRLIAQRRVRDYDDLLREVDRIPTGNSEGQAGTRDSRRVQ